MSETAKNVETRAIQKAAAPFVTRPLEDVLELRRKVVQLMSTAMKQNVDYGIIPGCEKPSLWQPGAQKIFSLFQLDCKLERQTDSIIQHDPPFILHSYLARAVHVPSGIEVSQGVGSCNSGEEKYGWRKQKRVCPKCGKANIMRGKEEYGGGWLCWAKLGGCGAKFAKGDSAIESQPEGRIANENIWEQENTIRKMAAKRAEVHLALNLGLSDIFTQDVEDMAEFGAVSGKEEETPHREKHEHFSTLCQVCLDAGVPEGEKVMVLGGHWYLRSHGGDHGPEYGTNKFCPGCQEDLKKAETGYLPEQNPDMPTVPPPEPPTVVTIDKKKIPTDLGPFMEHMERAKRPFPDGVGEVVYYDILKSFGFEKKSQAKTKGARNKVLRKMIEKFQDMKLAAAQEKSKDSGVRRLVCVRCGSPIENRPLEGGTRFFCPNKQCSAYGVTDAWKQKDSAESAEPAGRAETGAGGSLTPSSPQPLPTGTDLTLTADDVLDPRTTVEGYRKEIIRLMKVNERAVLSVLRKHDFSSLDDVPETEIGRLMLIEEIERGVGQ